MLATSLRPDLLFAMLCQMTAKTGGSPKLTRLFVRYLLSKTWCFSYVLLLLRIVTVRYYRFTLNPSLLPPKSNCVCFSTLTNYLKTEPVHFPPTPLKTPPNWLWQTHATFSYLHAESGVTRLFDRLLSNCDCMSTHTQPPQNCDV